MRIALFSAFFPFRGGIAQFSARLYRSLERENEVKAYTFTRQYPKLLFPGTSQLVESTDSADRIPAEGIVDSINPLTYRNAAKRINAGRPELIISQYWMPFFAPVIGTMHKYMGRKGVKRISILHNLIPHEKRFYDARANAYFLKHNDGYVVMSDAVLADLLLLKPNAKYLRIDHPSYDHFGEPVDRLVALNSFDLDPSMRYILIFGFIRDYKGLDLLIESMVDLSAEFHLIIAGECYGDFSKYERQIEQNGLKDRVHVFNRYIPDTEVKMFFSASDVCVLPYRSATQSGITAIANHFALPVIATDVGGLKESISHDVDGLLVSNADPHLIGNAIKKYFREGKELVFRKKLEETKNQKSWSAFAQRVIDFAESI